MRIKWNRVCNDRDQILLNLCLLLLRERLPILSSPFGSMGCQSLQFSSLGQSWRMEPTEPIRSLPRSFQIGVKGRGVASFRWQGVEGVRQEVGGVQVAQEVSV